MALERAHLENLFSTREPSLLGETSPASLLGRERVLALEITMQWIPTGDMLADIFTKCLDKTTFLKLRDMLLTEIG